MSMNIVLLGCMLGPPLIGVDDQKAISRELVELDRLDQEDQRNWEELGDAEMSRRQKVRRERVAEIVAAGQLAGPEDFHHAAWILQHGTEIEDSLMAHVLASHAAFEKHEAAAFMSAAGLDRFLQFSGHAQRFGSQFSDAAGQEQGDRGKLLPDSIVAVYRGRATGLNGKAMEEGWRSRSNLRQAARDLSSFAKKASKEERRRADAKKQKGGGQASSERARAEWEQVLSRTREIVDRGQLESPEDYYRAAEVLALGTGTEDFLLAHIMATTAGVLGHRKARPLFATTLDRTLLALGRAPMFDDEIPEGTRRSPILTLHPRLEKRLLGK